MQLLFFIIFTDSYKNATQVHEAVKLSKHKEASTKKMDTRKHSINKRAVSCPVKYLEVRLLLDKDMFNYHGQKVVRYSLTVMNIVSTRHSKYLFVAGPYRNHASGSHRTSLYKLLMLFGILAC